MRPASDTVFDKRVVETSDVKESNTMKGIASTASFLPKTHSKKGVATMNRDESHRQGRGLSLPPGTSSAANSRIRAAGSPGTCDDCPEFRQLSETSAFFFARAYLFSITYEWQRNCTVTGARFQTRPNVKNPKRSERPGRPENQRSIGWKELSRIEKANRIRRNGSSHRAEFARANASGSRGGQILGAMRF